ncbi:MAG: class I SAM-dependent methyltransferase [Alphaproteobacteria bacterium]|nr:class I SAM-dependent methyltransferase [Alphaproteobacteria bacterium]
MVRRAQAVTPLSREIARRIRSAGPLPVAEYMALALTDPEHGYYTTRDPLGAAGDFVTAPEISQMFGEMIGAWCAVAWQYAGAPHRIALVELGPGRGTLMADMLRAAAALPPFRAALDIHLVETSPALRAAQRAALGGATAAWHEAPETLPPGPMLLVANEFFDALPIRQYQRTGGAWRERLVGLDESSGALRFALASAPAAEAAGFPPALAAAPEGAIVERCPAAEAVIHDIAARIARDGGAALIVDYGPMETAPGDSFQAVKAHGYADALAAPGEADLTAHVDFAGLAARARAAGAAAFGPVPQGAFLKRLGIARRLEKLCAGAEPAQADGLRAGYDRLIAEDGMGTLFKALGIAHASLGTPAGFEE